jgi:hypothetical protein
VLRKIATATVFLALVGSLGLVGWLLHESHQRETDLARRVAQLEDTVAKQKQSAQLTDQLVAAELKALPAIDDRLDKIERSSFDFGRPDTFGPSLESRISTLESDSESVTDPTVGLTQLTGDMTRLIGRIDRLCGSLTFEVTIVSC